MWVSATADPERAEARRYFGKSVGTFRGEASVLFIDLILLGGDGGLVSHVQLAVCPHLHPIKTLRCDVMRRFWRAENFFMLVKSGVTRTLDPDGGSGTVVFEPSRTSRSVSGCPHPEH